jgi:hypothetical protein
VPIPASTAKHRRRYFELGQLSRRLICGLETVAAPDKSEQQAGLLDDKD